MNLSQIWHRRLELTVLLGLGATLMFASPAGARTEAARVAVKSQQSINSLPAGAHAAISAALGRDDAAYQAKPNGAGFEISNARNHLNAAFTRAGVTFHSDENSWGMTLTEWGYGSSLKPSKAAVLHATANRIEYARGPVTEWYENGPMGLEQGFTLSRRPAESAGIAHSELALSLSLSGDLKATVDASHTALDLASRDGRTRLRYSGMSAKDADGRALPARLEVSGSRLLLKVDDRAAHYPVTIDPWVQSAKFTSADVASGDYFGWSVAISGNTAVVGAVNATVSSGKSGPGAAYVFTIAAGAATQVAKLLASDGVAGDVFGGSVAISGSTIVVGAWKAEIGSNTGQGAAYVFVEPASGGWSGTMNETAKLTSSDGAAYDAFGVSVATDSGTIVVGAPGSEMEGAAYVYLAPSGGWSAASRPMTQTAKLSPSDGEMYGNFGESVAIGGNTVVAGALCATIGANAEQGAAYVYVEPTGGWSGTPAAPMTQTAKLLASDGARQSYLGTAVAISGNTIVAGAAPGNGVNTNPGATYVYVKPSGGWGTPADPMYETAELTASDGSKLNGFGSSVSIGTNTGAGQDTVVVGAPYMPYTGSQAGAVYIFTEQTGTWAAAAAAANGPLHETAKLTASDAHDADNLGSSVAIDGTSGTVLAGARGVATQRGAVYVYTTSLASGQTITFDPVQTPVYATQSVPLAASTDSGLEVTFTSQTTSVCSINSGSTSLNGNVTTSSANLLAYGTCIIQATQNGNSTYAAAAPVTQSFTVTAEPQTITFDTIGTQGLGTQLALSASASSGLTVSFNSQTTSVCTVSGNTASFIATGQCTIEATQAGNSIYAAASPVDRSFGVGTPAFSGDPRATDSMMVFAGATSGNTAMISVLGSNGFSGTVNLTCSVTTSLTNVVDMPTCSLNPTSVAVSGSTPGTSTLTVTTTGKSSAANRTRNLLWPRAGGPILALLGFFFVPRRRSGWLAMLMFAAVLSMVGASCGGSGKPSTTAGSYTVTVTGTSGSVTATVATIALTVQ